MPEPDYVCLPREDLLRIEEIRTLVDVFLNLGVDKVRLTGGEPLLRHDIAPLISMLAGKPTLQDLALTTNGVLLAEHVDALHASGLHRITVSLDTLRRDRFIALTRFDRLDAVREGLAAAHRVYGRVKIDAVVIRGVNNDELADLIEFGRRVNAEVRFIKYMDVGGASRWSSNRVVSRDEILDALSRRHGLVDPIMEPESTAPADRFALPDGTVFGVISSTTSPFCRTCDRRRLTADGMWYLCLYALEGIDLRRPLRRGAAPGELSTLIADGWRARDDRGAEARLALGERRALVPVQNCCGGIRISRCTRGADSPASTRRRIPG